MVVIAARSKTQWLRTNYRYSFWINVPCGGVAFIIILVFLKRNICSRNCSRTIRERLVGIDPVGSLLLLLGITTFLIGIQWGGTKYAWSNPKVWGSLVASGLCITVFGAIEWKLGDKANIPARIFYQRTIISSSLFSCFLSMAFYM